MLRLFPFYTSRSGTDTDSSENPAAARKDTKGVLARMSYFGPYSTIYNLLSRLYSTLYNRLHSTFTLPLCQLLKTKRINNLDECREACITPATLQPGGLERCTERIVLYLHHVRMHLHDSRHFHAPACSGVDNKASAFQGPLVHSQVSELPIFPSLRNRYNSG